MPVTGYFDRNVYIRQNAGIAIKKC